MDQVSIFMKCMSAVLCTLILTVGGCETYTRHVAASMVNNGADPLRVRCLMSATNDVGIAAICAQLANK